MNWVKKKDAGPLGRYETNKTCRNSGCFNYERNHYFVNSTDKSDRSQVIPLITGIFLLNFYKYMVCARSVKIFRLVLSCTSTIIKIFRPICTAVGKQICHWRVVLYRHVILALWGTSGSCRSIQCICCQTYFACFYNKRTYIYMQTF